MANAGPLGTTNDLPATADDAEDPEPDTDVAGAAPESVGLLLDLHADPPSEIITVTRASRQK